MATLTGVAAVAALILLRIRQRRRRRRQKSPPIMVRAATMGDLAAIKHMTSAMAIESEGVELPDTDLDRGVRTMLAGKARLQPKYWVACADDGRVVGIIGVSPEWSDWWGTNYWPVKILQRTFLD